VPLQPAPQQLPCHDEPPGWICGCVHAVTSACRTAMRRFSRSVSRNRKKIRGPGQRPCPGSRTLTEANRSLTDAAGQTPDQALPRRVPAGDGSLTTSARMATELKSEAEEVVGLRKQGAALRSVWPGGLPGLNQTWPSRPRNASRARPTPRMIRNCCPLNLAALVELGSGSESETSGVPLGLLMNKGDNDESLHA
jgi:hypothetical protein